MADAADTPRTVRYPSEELPGIPAFELDVPAGWEVGQLAGVLLATGPATWDGPFRPNLTVGHGLVPKDADLEALANGYAAEAATANPVEVVNFERNPDDAFDGAQLVVRLTLTEIDTTIVQNLVLVRLATRPELSQLADLFTITASYDESRKEEAGPDLLATLRSFNLL